jgi:hypothetical protein
LAKTAVRLLVPEVVANVRITGPSVTVSVPVVGLLNVIMTVDV